MALPSPKGHRIPLSEAAEQTKRYRSSMTIAIAISCGDEHLIDGELIYVYADSHAKKSVAIPDAWRERIAQVERVKETLNKSRPSLSNKSMKATH